MRPKDETVGGCVRTDCRYRWAAREMPEIGKLESAEAPAGGEAPERRGPNRRCLTCGRRGLPPQLTTEKDINSGRGRAS